MNNFMIHYLLWRCMTGRHTNITLSFLVVGHTKFAPDACFGLFDRLFGVQRLAAFEKLHKWWINLQFAMFHNSLEMKRKPQLRPS